MKTYTISLTLLLLIAGCAMLPPIRNGKLDPSKKQAVPVWDVDDYVEDVMESKGYEKPKANLDDESALWLWIAGVCALGGVGCCVAGYLTTWNKLVIVGAGLVACGVVATVISAIIGIIAWIGGAMLVAGLAYLGWKLRNHKLQVFR